MPKRIDTTLTKHPGRYSLTPLTDAVRFHRQFGTQRSPAPRNRTSFTKPDTIYGSRDNQAGGSHLAEHTCARVPSQPYLGGRGQRAHRHAWATGDLALWLVVTASCALHCLRQARVPQAPPPGEESL